MTAAQQKKIEALVERKLLEFFGDPDAGLELRKDFAAELRKRLKKKQRLISHADVMKRYGLR